MLRPATFRFLHTRCQSLLPPLEEPQLCGNLSHGGSPTRGNGRLCQALSHRGVPVSIVPVSVCTARGPTGLRSLLCNASQGLLSRQIHARSVSEAASGRCGTNHESRDDPARKSLRKAGSKGAPEDRLQRFYLTIIQPRCQQLSKVRFAS